MKMKITVWSLVAVIGIITLAVLVLPVTAAETGYDYPVLDNSVASQKAHLTWKAAERETGMSASIAYIETLNGSSTSALDAALTQYKSREGQIASLSTHIGINNLIRDMNQINLQFRQELRSQMKTGRGKPADLKALVDSAVQDNADLASLESSYWSLRTTNELANFDNRVQRATNLLANLIAKGYDTTRAQVKLDEIAGQRSALESALETHDHTRIQAVQQQILVLSRELAVIVKDLQVQVPQEKRIQYQINEGNRAAARADRVNADLKTLNLDTSMAEQYTAAAKTHLMAAQVSLDGKNTGDAQASLDAAKMDLKNLSQAYKDIALRYEVVSSTESTLTSMAQALDGTTASMGSGQ